MSEIQGRHTHVRVISYGEEKKHESDAISHGEEQWKEGQAKEASLQVTAFGREEKSSVEGSRK